MFNSTKPSMGLHLEPATAQRLMNLIKRYWCVFNPEGLKHTVIGYKCTNDTGNHKPVAAKNPNYGPRESVITKKHIAVLNELNQVEQPAGSGWLAKALLAPKPHQEHIYDLAKFK